MYVCVRETYATGGVFLGEESVSVRSDDLSSNVANKEPSSHGDTRVARTVVTNTMWMVLVLSVLHSA